MLVEQIVAMAILFSVLLTLLGALGSGAAGVVNGRQRAVATALGKQAIERLQGSAYSSVAMNLASPGLTADPRVTGTAPVLRFESEQLVGGGPTAYRSTATVSGTAYTLSTFITAVTPASGLPYRRITVFVDWTPSTSGTFHTERFSSLVYPLDYSSFPAGSGLAEATGASLTVSGSLGADGFDDVRVALPRARAATSASTLRTGQATASGPTGLIALTAGPLTSTDCTAAGYNVAECPISTLDRMADNDVTTSAPTALGGSAALYGGATVVTPGGLTVTLPGASNDAHASVDACGGCGFGDADAVPWADATSTTSGGASATFDVGGGDLSGALWQVDSGWSVTATADHDADSGGTVGVSAQLTAPAAKLLTVAGPAGFDGAVRVGAFTAAASAFAGSTATNPACSASSVAVDLWDDSVGGYRTVAVTPGTATDVSATGTVSTGSDVIAFTSRVQSQPRTSSTQGSAPRTDAAAQHPSLLVVTVQVTITGAHPGSLALTFDYGSVTARGTWRVA